MVMKDFKCLQKVHLTLTKNCTFVKKKIYTKHCSLMKVLPKHLHCQLKHVLFKVNHFLL